ncbi:MULTISPECIES: hypothetical protein [unclassified Microbacterium]|uniref:hypothetical protein n=1 Tax=unclassified Microbacterium TaxID=2609290 RepID=UPI003866518C
MSSLHAPQRTSAVTAALQHPTLADRRPRTSWPDRLAMRLAVALLLWSSRPQATPDDLERRQRNHRDRVAREAEWQLRQALLAPRR